MLTKPDILLILERLRREVIVPPNESFPFEVTRRRSAGYSDDPTIGGLEAKLSIMLQAAREE